MLLNFKNIRKLIPTIKFELNGNETSFWIPANFLPPILLFFKNHCMFQFKLLTYIAVADFPDNSYRFMFIYELLSIKYNFRLKIKVLLDDLSSIKSCERIFSSSSWWECEIWDMFGIFFMEHSNLIKLLTDYGFEGYPLRKDFPLGGFCESRYSLIKNRIIFENVELAQEYRAFSYVSPWENSC